VGINGEPDDSPGSAIAADAVNGLDKIAERQYVLLVIGFHAMTISWEALRALWGVHPTAGDFRNPGDLWRGLFTSAAALCRVVRSRSGGRVLFMKVLADFRRDLAIRHLVDGFNRDDVPTELVFLEAPFQLALCLSGTEQQN
jgi:hypothetical protein